MPLKEAHPVARSFVVGLKADLREDMALAAQMERQGSCMVTTDLASIYAKEMCVLPLVFSLHFVVVCIYAKVSILTVSLNIVANFNCSQRCCGLLGGLGSDRRQGAR